MNGKSLVIGSAIVALVALCAVAAVAAFVGAQSPANEFSRASAQSGASGNTEAQGASNNQVRTDDDVTEAETLLRSANINMGEAEDAALGAVSGEIMENSLDYEFGRAAYTVEVLDQQGTLHEVYVDAENGDILRQYTQDQEDAAEARSVIERASIDRSAAEDTALNEVPGDIVGTSLEDEDGRALYSVEILGDDGDLHEVYVDAESGDILGQDTEGRDGSEREAGFDG